ncbi:MAG: hypothetical protein K6A80_01560 [Saccharofermentans sp.]|nr:hypothetical protein [Saccharofermentans sp.]
MSEEVTQANDQIITDLITVNNTAIPGLTTFTATPNDLDSEETGRSPGSGVLHRERIRSEVYDLAFTCAMIDDVTLASLQSMLAPAKVSVTFWIGKTVNCYMYAGAPTIELVFKDSDGKHYWNFSGTLTMY